MSKNQYTTISKKLDIPEDKVAEYKESFDMFDRNKKGKITIIFHPNSILLNHASEELSFYYGKRKNREKDNKEIPGKITFRGLTDKKGNIFLLKNDIDKIHLKFNNYISEPFSLDVIAIKIITIFNFLI